MNGHNPFGLHVPALLSSSCTATNCLQPFAFPSLSLFLSFAPTTFSLFYFLSSLSTGPLLLLSVSPWFPRSLLSPLLHIQTHPSSAPGSRGPGECWQCQGSLPALCMQFLPGKATSSGRKGSTVDKEPVCQLGTKPLHRLEYGQRESA